MANNDHRLDKIITILQKDREVSVTNLSERFIVTQETIRRDLEKLQDDGLVTRTYGGCAQYGKDGGGNSLNELVPSSMQKPSKPLPKKRFNLSTKGKPSVLTRALLRWNYCGCLIITKI